MLPLALTGGPAPLQERLPGDLRLRAAGSILVNGWCPFAKLTLTYAFQSMPSFRIVTPLGHQLQGRSGALPVRFHALEELRRLLLQAGQLKLRPLKYN